MPHIPNHPSARKRHRQSLTRAARNRSVKTRVRTSIKQANEAIAGSDQDAAQARLKTAISLLDKAASKGTMHRNTVRRKIAHLSAAMHRKRQAAES